MDKSAFYFFGFSARSSSVEFEPDDEKSEKAGVDSFWEKSPFFPALSNWKKNLILA